MGSLTHGQSAGGRIPFSPRSGPEPRLRPPETSAAIFGNVGERQSHERVEIRPFHRRSGANANSYVLIGKGRDGRSSRDHAQRDARPQRIGVHVLTGEERNERSIGPSRDDIARPEAVPDQIHQDGEHLGTDRHGSGLRHGLGSCIDEDHSRTLAAALDIGDRRIRIPHKTRPIQQPCLRISQAHRRLSAAFNHRLNRPLTRWVTFEGPIPVVRWLCTSIRHKDTVRRNQRIWHLNDTVSPKRYVTRGTRSSAS